MSLQEHRVRADSLDYGSAMSKVGSLQQHRVGNRLLVSIQTITAYTFSTQETGTSIWPGSYIRTWTDSSVKSRDVAKLKASIVDGDEAACYSMPWRGSTNWM